MGSRRRYLRIRHYVIGLLLAAYGSAGLLGYGLHAIWQCEHGCAIAGQHEHGFQPKSGHRHVCGAQHDHGRACPHHHEQDAVGTAPGPDGGYPVILAVDDCPICNLLVQAQTPPAIAPTLDFAGIQAVAHIFASSPYATSPLGAHLARGPPRA